jgi:hypothetical protein
MFSPEFFRRTMRCHLLSDDTIYLPNCNLLSLSSLTGDWWKEVVSEHMLPIACMSSFNAAQCVKEVFFHHLKINDGEEPAWVYHLSATQLRSYRVEYAMMETDVFSIIPCVHYTGVGFVMICDGLTQETYNVFSLWRLQHIAQLGKLHGPVITESGSPGILSAGSMFSHNRLAHSYDVRAIGLLIAANNGLTETDTRTLEIAGLTHDTRTPCYGDGTKPIDPVLFDEDLNYPKLLHGADWERLRDRYHIDEQLLIDTVQGKGMLGTLLDIADKISYLSADVEAYVSCGRPVGWNEYPGTYEEITGVLARRKYMLGLWSVVKVEDGKVFVDDASWLGDVLLLRALMFKNLYFHPGARYTERMIGTILVRHLIDTGKLQKEDLLRLTDHQMDDIIRKEFGHDTDPAVVGLYNEDQRVEVYPTLAEAERRMEQLLDAGMPIVFIDTHPPAKSGMHLLVRSGNAVIPFQEACPEMASQIDAIIKAAPTVKLYYLDTPYEALPPSFKKISDVIRSRRFSRR